jgi:CCR4-NOT transcription complex subunit 1
VVVPERRRLLHETRAAAAAGTRYNVPLLNALVLYVGVQAIQANRKEAASAITHSAPMDVFQRLAGGLFGTTFRPTLDRL